jgi:hypothetical protein
MECEAIWRDDVETLGGERYSENWEDRTFWILVPFLEAQGLRYTYGSIENVHPEYLYLWQPNQ